MRNQSEYIHTYILYCYLPNGAFQEQLFKLQLKLIKFKKTLTTLAKIVIVIRMIYLLID